VSDRCDTSCTVEIGMDGHRAEPTKQSTPRECDALQIYQNLHFWCILLILDTRGYWPSQMILFT
jgi:hypothetical protein